MHFFFLSKRKPSLLFKSFPPTNLKLFLLYVLNWRWGYLLSPYHYSKMYFGDISSPHRWGAQQTMKLNKARPRQATKAKPAAIFRRGKGQGVIMTALHLDASGNHYPGYYDEVFLSKRLNFYFLYLCPGLGWKRQLLNNVSMLLISTFIFNDY